MELLREMLSTLSFALYVASAIWPSHQQWQNEKKERERERKQKETEIEKKRRLGTSSFFLPILCEVTALMSLWY